MHRKSCKSTEEGQVGFVGAQEGYWGQLTGAAEAYVKLGQTGLP